MASLQRWHLSTSALLLAGLLSACGGGGGSGAVTPTTPVPIPEPDAPVATNNTETDGFNWFNFRRKQIGIPLALTPNATIATAARNHSKYLVAHNVFTHGEIASAGDITFTGVDQFDRMKFAGYSVIDLSAYGEVIAKTSNPSGFYQAEELITAIYHRFAIFEPSYKEAGVGAATSTRGEVYVTTNFVANNGFGSGIGKGKIVSYPFDGQTNVVTNFSSNTETPDPVPDADEVGYPISVHADLNSTMVATSFSVSAPNGSKLVVKELKPGGDVYTPKWAAAIIPMSRLSAKTAYTVNFTGTVDGAAVNKTWSFTTR